MGVSSFEDLTCWKEARELANLVYSACQRAPLARDFGACDQFRRASISVMNNIAEGFGRTSPKELHRFLDFAQSSALEVKSMTYILGDQMILTSTDALAIRTKAETAKRRIRALMFAPRQSNET